MAAFPLTDVMQLKLNFFLSGKIMVTDVGRFTYIAVTALAIIFNQRREKEAVWRAGSGAYVWQHGWYKHVQCQKGVIHPSINSKASPLNLRVATYEGFLGGCSKLKNDHVIFMYTRWPVNAKKNCFHCCFVIYSFFELPEIPPHASVKTFFAIYGSFCKMYVFPLGIFSLCNFSLCNLKGNGNAATVFNK